jgi:hypothetical protein
VQACGGRLRREPLSQISPPNLFYAKKEVAHYFATVTKGPSIYNNQHFKQYLFIYLFSSYISLQNDNGPVKRDITVKFSTWNLKDLTRILL